MSAALGAVFTVFIFPSSSRFSCTRRLPSTTPTAIGWNCSSASSQIPSSCERSIRIGE